MQRKEAPRVVCIDRFRSRPNAAEIQVAYRLLNRGLTEIERARCSDVFDGGLRGRTWIPTLDSRIYGTAASRERRGGLVLGGSISSFRPPSWSTAPPSKRPSTPCSDSSDQGE